MKVNLVWMIGAALMILSCGGEEVKKPEKKEVDQPSHLTTTKSGVIDENVDLSDQKLDYEVVRLERTDEKCKDSGFNCTRVSLEYPDFSGKGSRKANVLCVRKVSEHLGYGDPDPDKLIDLDESVDKYFNQYHIVQKEVPQSRPWYAETKVVGHNYHEGVLSIKIASLYDLGTGEPNKELWAININEETGEEIRVIDHITDAPSFIMLCENEFRNHFGFFNNQNLNSKGFTFDYDAFRLPIQYAMTAEGLELIYNPEEIAPLSKGIISFIIPYDKIGPLLDLSQNHNSEGY